ncbi:hypothetical protein [Bacillus marasmi]|uniref:hypothetical protein n=1 Tax=Bacillus marasmi TaxID=1926279 RepID=UPI0011C84C94|nr:hypothetical protein [Bacillus marasmi]
MHIIAGYQSSKFLEMAIQEIKDSGINEERIVTIEMKNNERNAQVLDTIMYSDGFSILDGMAVWSVVGALFGIIWGANLIIGPIATGLFGFFLGASLGFVIDKSFRRKKRGNERYKNYIDFLIIIKCINKEQFQKTASIFQKYHAVSIGYHSPNASRESI